MHKILLTTALCCPTLALASGLAAPAGGYSVEYTGFSHGFTVLKFAGTLNMTPTGYGAHITFHTAGMAAWMLRTDNDSEVAGSFQGDRAAPSLFSGTGHLRGTARETRIAYADGNPVVQVLTPPVERERTAVPPDQTKHTIDTLSAVVMLVHDVATTGRCDGTVTTFDGRRLAVQTSHTSGTESLPRTDKSMFAGPALRCDFDGQQLAGFVTNENQASLRKPRHGTAWLAPVLPDAPPVPVRVAFDNNILGQVTLYLTSAAPAPAK